jgi:hypothetical protein
MNIQLVRAVVVYIALVGLPVVALVGVLRVGSGLDAPPPIGGAWVTDASPELLECTGFEQGSAVTIEQSGAHVRVHAGPSYGDGRMEGGRTRVALRAPGGACAGHTIETDFAPEAALIAWNARAPSCAACGPIRFSTSRPPEE